MSESNVKKLINEAKEATREAKEIAYYLLNEPMPEKHKKKILELCRLLK